MVSAIAILGGISSTMGSVTSGANQLMGIASGIGSTLNNMSD